MAILCDTEIVHPELGPIRFDNGKADPDISGSVDSDPAWVCRPDGWDSDFEILIPGDVNAPCMLDVAINAFKHRKEIETEGKNLGTGNIEIAWIDLTRTPPIASFSDNDEIYVLWTGLLNSQWKIVQFTKGNW